jgi:acetylornithine deacetylase/succinyl-diaminopimelate desuccinylase-like protein
VALDSGCGDYERLWLSTSLRGLVNGVLTVQVLEEGIHSGATGIVPSSFRVLRQLLARLEDERTGEILPRSLQVTIPADRVEQARAVAGVLGENLFRRYPVLPGVRPAVEDPAELVLNFTWRPALAVTGAAGLPAPADAGNVLHAMTALKLSLRLPPTLDAAAAGRALKALFEADPPSGARVTFTPEGAASGWSAPPASPWLEQALRRASLDYFGAPALASGEGGSIPFMTMLNERFPHAQFMVTGLLGPGSNAHGPNEFLHLPTAVRLTASVARVLHDHWQAHTG